MGNGPQVRRQEHLLPAARDFLLVTARAKCAPAMPFPLLQMASITTSPINCLTHSSFAPVECWRKKPKCWSSGYRRLESGGAEIALSQSRRKKKNIYIYIYTHFSALRYGKMRCVSL
jgi:hypothetical protein